MRTHSGCGNPVRRTSDRVQWWLSHILLAIMVVGLPAAVVSTGLLTYHAQLNTAQAQHAPRHPVTAPTDDLVEVLDRATAEPPILVLDDGRLVGLVTAEELTRIARTRLPAATHGA
ncbi:hypothetical protein P3T27_003416 [Kitasatospora sp. MAA19]|uniref:hypothetical protein n=1 Tax=Kitasatospora sp. MAA19 TaxID=3035090 RepID=UPI002475AB5D|nr:hypothetical protein [Kitasatospora sp. MAA19]MDH6706689.1 hypothetical protein [Kitasatospora sp. MAA19]